MTAIQDARGHREKAQNGIGITENADAMYTIDKVSRHGIQHAQTVRRLTPTECERLQGFPDGWTDIPDAKDGPRYAAMGDAVTVPVIRWLGERMTLAQRSEVRV